MGIFDRFISSKPPTKDQFAQKVLDGIKRAGEKRAVVFDKDRFSLHTTDGGILNLTNAYPEFCAAPKEMRAESVNKWVRMWFARSLEIPDDFDDVRADLLPTVQARSHYDLVNLQFEVEGRMKLNRPYAVFGEHFAVGLVYDLPESMQHVNQDKLDKWGVTLYEVLEVAKQNLAERQFAFAGPQGGVGMYWCSMQKDSYDAARILLLDAIRDFKVRGEIVAMIPNRETLYVAGSEDMHALKEMLKAAAEEMQKPRYISGIALRLDGDEWVPWLPAEDHPLYQDFHKLRTQTFGQAYGEQKELLDKLHEKTGQDIFVASFSGMGKKDTNELTSFCVWGKDVLGLASPYRSDYVYGRTRPRATAGPLGSGGQSRGRLDGADGDVP